MSVRNPHSAFRGPLERLSPTLYGAFGRYVERFFRKSFTAVRLSKSGERPPTDRGAILCYSNHPSWWDPLLYMVLAKALLPERFACGPMDEAALEKYRFLKRLGVFAVEQGTVRGARQFLRGARSVLSRPDGLLWVAAQGRFADPRERPVELLPGIEHLTRTLPELWIFPVAIEYPFWDEKLPEAIARFGPPVAASELAGSPSRRRSEVLATRLEATMDVLASEVQSRELGVFETLVRGRTGVGGIYDYWRRLRASVRGESFDPAHGWRPRS